MTGYFLTTQIFQHLFSLHRQWIAVCTFRLVLRSIIVLVFGHEGQPVSLTGRMRVFHIRIILLKIGGIPHTAFPPDFSGEIFLNFSRFEYQRRTGTVVSIEGGFSDRRIPVWLEDKIVAVGGGVLVGGRIEALGVV